MEFHIVSGRCSEKKERNLHSERHCRDAEYRRPHQFPALQADRPASLINFRNCW